MTQNHSVHHRPRTFRYVPRSIKPLGQNLQHKFAAQHALVHYPSGSIYSFIPKNACSTMRVSLALSHGCIGNPKEDWTWIHQNNATFSASLRELVCTPFSFVILRCPYTRLASAFLDKVVSRQQPFHQLRQSEKETFSHLDLSFRRFVELLAKPGNIRLNIHWRPQVDFLVYEEYDAWYALERFSQYEHDMTARTGLQLVDARALSKHDTEATSGVTFADAPDRSVAQWARDKDDGLVPDKRILYDDELRASVKRLYAADIALYASKLDAADLLFP